MSTSAAHVRVNHGVLAAAEKRVLVWMATRLPQWVTSDQLTVLALLAMAVAGGAFWWAGRWPPAVWMVVVALGVNWFGDSLDGTLARVRHVERPRFGYYVDHVLDISGTSLLLGGLALSGYMTPVVALGVLATYLLVSAEVYLGTASHGRFRMSFVGVGPTELRIVLAVGAVSLLWWPVVRPLGLGPWLLFDVGGIVAAIGLLVAFVVSTARTTAALYREEPLPSAPHSAGDAITSPMRARV